MILCATLASPVPYPVVGPFLPVRVDRILVDDRIQIQPDVPLVTLHDTTCTSLVFSWQHFLDHLQVSHHTNHATNHHQHGQRRQLSPEWINMERPPPALKKERPPYDNKPPKWLVTGCAREDRRGGLEDELQLSVTAAELHRRVQALQGKRTCPKCQRECSMYCYTCYTTFCQLPQVVLPLLVDMFVSLYVVFGLILLAHSPRLFLISQH